MTLVERKPLSPGLKNTSVGNESNLPFIVSTDRQKEDPATRKLIRSHVMRGKNRVKPRRKPRVPLQESKLKAGLPVNDPVLPSSVSRMLCSKFSAIPFADDVEPALIEDLLSFSTIFSKAMFVLDECITSPTAGLAQAWFTPLLSDPAYLYAVCFTIQTYFDGILGRTRSAEAQRKDRVYYAKTVRMLQDRLALDDDSVRLSDSTIMTVLSLSGHAYTIGDYEAASHHINGLLKLVGMRGVGTFQENTKLLIEIVRSDLGMAMDSGSKPVLFTHENIPWSLILPSNSTTLANGEVLSKTSEEGMSDFQTKLSPELATVWSAMSEFCALINTAATQTGAKLTEEAFLHSMGSIMYRLLHQRFPAGTLDELFRLGMLAFSAPIFLHWNRTELPDRRFTSAYQDAIARLDPVEAHVGMRGSLWLLMVGALVMSQEPDGISWIGPRLQRSIEMCDVCGWDGVREMLGSCLWVGMVYDRPGKEIFDSIRS